MCVFSKMVTVNVHVCSVLYSIAAMSVGCEADGELWFSSDMFVVRYTFWEL